MYRIMEMISKTIWIFTLNILPKVVTKFLKSIKLYPTKINKNDTLFTNIMLL